MREKCVVEGNKKKRKGLKDIKCSFIAFFSSPSFSYSYEGIYVECQPPTRLNTSL